MAKEQKQGGSSKGKSRDELFQNRLKDMYSSQEALPASISIRQAEELMTRLKELETQLAARAGSVKGEAGLGISSFPQAGVMLEMPSRSGSLETSGTALSPHRPGQEKPGQTLPKVSRLFQQPRIQTRLTALVLIVTVPLLIGITTLISSWAGTRIEANANEDLRQNSEALASNISSWMDQNIRSLQELVLLPDIISMQADQQRPVLQAMAQTHPYMYLVSTTDLAGMNVARNDDADPSDYSDRVWFRNAKAGELISYQSLIGRTSGKPALVVSTPIRNVDEEIIGVGMFAADLTDLSEQTRVRKIGESGYVYIVDANNMVLAHPDPVYTTDELHDESAYPPVATMRTGQTGLITFTDEDGVRWRAYVNVLDNGWGIIAQQPEAEILAPVHQFQRIAIIAILAGTLVMLSLSWLAIRRTLLPIGALTETVAAIAAGDLNRVADVKSRDEVGILASAFNNMTSQLRGLIGSLEQRVLERTHGLELAAEVGRTITEKVANLDELLASAAEMIRARFDLYYTQVYLTDPSEKILTLRAGTGEVGKQLLQRGHHLPITPGSLNGEAASGRKAVIVPDTSLSPTFLPNPLLPKTRSEMAVPLIVGGQVIGVLDMQSESQGALNESNLPAFEALAGQLAVAIQNAGLFAQTQEARMQVEANIRQVTKTGWQEFMNSIDRSERIGYLFDQAKATVIKDATGEESLASLSMPVTVLGAEVGKIHAVDANRSWSKQDQEIIGAAATYLGQRLESLRLLSQAETYRAEAEQAVRRLTREGWESYLTNQAETSSGFVYDQNEVKQLDGNTKGKLRNAFRKPLMVGNEAIGELAVDTGTLSEETAEILDSVARQLGSHLENLRLLDEAETGRLEIEKSQSRLQSLIENAAEAILVLDMTNGKFAEPNENAAILYGLPIKELVKVGPAEMSPEFQPDGRPSGEAAMEKINEALQGGTPVFEWIHRNAQGKEFPCEVRLVRLPGDKPHLRVTVTDITERKKAEETIARRAAELATVARVSTTTSTTLDPDQLLQSVVDLTKQQFGVYHAHIYLANESRQALMLAAGAGEVGRSMVAKGFSISKNAEKSLVARSARERQAVIANDVRSEPDFLANPALPETRSELAVPMIVGDQVLGVFDVQSDQIDGFTTEDANIYTTLASQVAIALQNARLYAEQGATVNQLRELDRLKNSFLANMSHELRTPLNSILGFSDVMLEELDGPLTEEMSNDLHLIQKNGQHLLHLINDVLDMAKIEAGRMNLSPEKIVLPELLNEVINITSPLAEEKNLALSLAPDSDPDLEIFADRTRLSQIMINLVNNSIKFTDKGEISIRSTLQPDEKIVISIKDTGIGIPPDKLETVFQEFAQIDTSTTRKAGGTGLGLPISRKLVEIHGGRLWAESTGVSGEGSTFYVELPLVAKITEAIEKQEK